LQKQAMPEAPPTISAVIVACDALGYFYRYAKLLYLREG
jgi:hypothetical protein